MASSDAGSDYGSSTLFSTARKVNSLLEDYTMSDEDEMLGVRIWPYGDKLEIRLYQSDRLDFSMFYGVNEFQGVVLSSSSRVWAEISESLVQEPDFTDLSIDGVRRKDLQHAFSIAEQCQSLTSFKINFAGQFESGPDAPISADDFRSLAAFLETSVVTHVDLDFRRAEGVTDDTFDAICRALSLGKSISTLAFHIRVDCSDSMMRSLSSVVASLPNLRSLDFSCQDFSPTEQICAAASFKKLETLSLHTSQISTSGAECVRALCGLRGLGTIGITSFSVKGEAREHIKQGLRHTRASALKLQFPNDRETLLQSLEHNVHVTEAICQGRYQLSDDDYYDNEELKQLKEKLLGSQQRLISVLLLRNSNLLSQWQSLAAVCKPTADSLPCFPSCHFRSAIFKFFLPGDFADQVAWPGIPLAPSVSDFCVQASDAMEVEPSDKRSSQRKRDRAQHQAETEVPPVEMSQEEKQSNSNLMKAIQESKAESVEHPLNADGVVLLRLSRMGRSPKITELFERSPHLEICRARMTVVGHTMFPEWTEARLLVPLLEEDFRETNIELYFDNIVALKSDIDAIRAALKTLSDFGRQRPALQFADPQAKRQRTHGAADGASGRANLPSASSSSQALPLQGDDSDDDMPVLVSIVSALSLRTDSSFGFPANPYASG